MKRIAILCGGPGPEHEISCISAAGILSALDRAQFQPVLVGITKDGVWVNLPLDYPLAIIEKTLPYVRNEFPTITLGANDLYLDSKALNIDVIFPVLHGEFGEGGQLQRMLDEAGIAYVGSGAVASEIAMDKARSKEYFERAGLKVADGFAITSDEWKSNSTAIHQRARELGLPLFVKAARGGSSRGTVKVRDLDSLGGAIEEALSFDTKVLIEGAIIGAEIECAVLESEGNVFASIPGKVWIDPHFEFYDFEAKYLDGATRIDIPAPLDPLVLAEVRHRAITAFEAIGCEGLARVDFFVTRTNEIIINEINTMPGQTPTSAYPKMLAASGITYTQAISQLLSI